ncbi:MAG TPA: L-type lectin-domain containing protein [Herpetosiphonaceae bacterium]
MDTTRFSRHRRTHIVPRWVSLTLLWAVLTTLLPLNSAPVHAATYTITAAMPKFTADNIGKWQLNHHALHSGDALRLTPLTENRPVPSRAGSAFLRDRVTLAEDRSFNAYFEMQISDPGTPYGQSGADGLVFTLQPISNTAVSFGGMAYEGLNPSVGIEFDTWHNSEWYVLDPDDNHVGLNILVRAIGYRSQPEVISPRLKLIYRTRQSVSCLSMITR